MVVGDWGQYQDWTFADDLNLLVCYEVLSNHNEYVSPQSRDSKQLVICFLSPAKSASFVEQTTKTETTTLVVVGGGVTSATQLVERKTNPLII